jgi:hypothetical protein
MRTKSLSKKLQLNKKTIAQLNANEQKFLKGGACTCLNTGCATYIWQQCGKFTDCACETLADPECFETFINC